MQFLQIITALWTLKSNISISTKRGFEFHVTVLLQPLTSKQLNLYKNNHENGTQTQSPSQHKQEPT